MREVKSVWGPWQDRDGRRFVLLRFADGRRKYTAYARWIMEQHVGRELARDEHVHHKDEDITNDTIDNFEILAAKDHARLHARAPEEFEVSCPECKTIFFALARRIRDNQDRRGSAGPFCKKLCARRWSWRMQINKPQATRAPQDESHGTRAGYRYGCRCELCRASNAARLRQYRDSLSRSSLNR